LKPGIRPVSKDAVVSPADGIVVHYGKANNEWIEQVKGVNYSLKSFLGPLSWNSSIAVDETEKQDDIDKAYHERLRQKKNEKTSLYQCVIYLAPGDYHRFHSPADWTVSFRRHFSGKLISIRPSFMSWISDLFSLNERVAYLGTWAHGFFSMTAVGATNVGSIKVYFDEQLHTNARKCRVGTCVDRVIDTVESKKGAAFGEFNLGSTIVLIFEAPDNLDFNIELGQKVRYGQTLFSINDDNASDKKRQD